MSRFDVRRWLTEQIKAPRYRQLRRRRGAFYNESLYIIDLLQREAAQFCLSTKENVLFEKIFV